MFTKSHRLTLTFPKEKPYFDVVLNSFKLLKGIQDYERILSLYEFDEISVQDAQIMLRDCMGDAAAILDTEL